MAGKARNWLIGGVAVLAALTCAGGPASALDSVRFPTKSATPDAVACRMVEADLCADELADDKPKPGNFCPRIGTATAVVIASGAETFAGSGKFRDAAFVALYGNVAIAAFRGTLTTSEQAGLLASVWDQVNNLYSALEPLPGGPEENILHAGYRAAFLNTIQPIRAALREWNAAGRLKKIYVTGHSKGGAVAVMAAASLRMERLPLAGVYTFAAPRPGNAAFQAFYAGLMNPPGGDRVPSYRYENAGDLIPHLPPTITEVQQLPLFERRMLRGTAARQNYRSVGSLIYILADGRVYEPPTPEAEIDLEKARADEYMGGVIKMFLPDSNALESMKDSHATDVATDDDSSKTRYYRTVCGVKPEQLTGSYAGD